MLNFNCFNTYDNVELDQCGVACMEHFKDPEMSGTRDWTREVIGWFRARRAPGTRPYPHENGAGEYLVDLCHLDYDDDGVDWKARWTNTLNRGRFGMRLALECEWGLKRELVLDDAGKLALIRADAKVMVFGSPDDSTQAALFDELRRLRSAARDSASWLCIDLPCGIAYRKSRYQVLSG